MAGSDLVFTGKSDDDKQTAIGQEFVLELLRRWGWNPEEFGV